MPWSRASELERVLACPAAGHLPRLELVKTSDAADWGTSTHCWKETGKPWEQYAKVFERRLAALEKAGMSRESLWPADGRHEVAVAVACGGWAFLEHEGDLAERDAWKQSFDQTFAVGTADYFGQLTGQWWVDDLKTGREVPTDPRELVQLQFYGSYLVRKHDVDEVLLSITHWPRYPADGAPVRYWAEWTEDDADVFLEQLGRARRAVLNSSKLPYPDARPGAHCCYCPAQAHCPELY